MAEIVQEKAVNQPTEKTVRTRSSFDLSYEFYQSMRFAEYCPHFVQEGVPTDKLPLRSAHRLMTYTLKAPLLSDLKMHKDYFFVPMQCILPLNWNKWYKTPAIGQDVPNDCGPSVDGFWNKVGTLAVNSFGYIPTLLGASPAPSASEAYDALFKLFVFFERFYSDGSLMSNLGIHGNQFFEAHWTNGLNVGDDISYDELFDYFIQKFVKGIGSSVVGYFIIQYGNDTSTI